MWSSTVVCPADTIAMAIFSKHILVQNAVSEVGVVVVPSLSIVVIAVFAAMVTVS